MGRSAFPRSVCIVAWLLYIQTYGMLLVIGMHDFQTKVSLHSHSQCTTTHTVPYTRHSAHGRMA